jgi:hypothetical protein
MSAAEAERLTSRLRLVAGTYAEARDELLTLVSQAKEGQAHVALGYPSWTAYIADVLGAEPLRLDRDDRQELVGVLRSEGMSTRAIAAALDVDDKTVRNDLAGAEYSAPETVTGTDGKTYVPRAADDEVVDAEIVDDDEVVDLHPQPVSKPRRKPIGEDVRAALIELERVARRWERIAADDRWDQYVDQRPGVRNDFRRMLATLTEVAR